MVTEFSGRHGNRDTRQHREPCKVLKDNTKRKTRYLTIPTYSNFLFGSHSRPTDRIRNINRELRVNYRDTLD